MKKFASIVITIIMIGFILLLTISIPIKSMASEAVSNAIVASETTSQLQQVIKENFPNVSNQQIEQVQEVISNSSSINSFTSDLLDQVSEAALNNETIDATQITDQISQLFTENISEIESVIGQEITDEQVALIQEKLSDPDGNLQHKIDSAVTSVTSGSSSTQDFLSTYQTITSTTVKVVCVIGIIVCIVLLGLLDKSLFRWMIYGGIGAIISAVIVGLFVPLVINAIEFTIGNSFLGMSIDIPVTSLRLEGLIIGVIGIILVVAYLILNRKYPRYERSYY
ncbi:MAG: hypothetical protein ACLRT4_07660 [Thomasclavelia sp.]